MSERVRRELSAFFDRARTASQDECENLQPHRVKRSNHNSDGRRSNGAKRRAQNRFWELNRFVDSTMRDLPRSELLVWLVLFRDAREGIAQTSRTDIARRTGVSVKTVSRAVASLMKRKLVRLLYRGGINRGVSRYLIMSASTRDTTVSR